VASSRPHPDDVAIDKVMGFGMTVRRCGKGLAGLRYLIAKRCSWLPRAQWRDFL